MTVPEADEAPEVYCRAIESHLCRKNDGHLVRIVGPAFEQVCGWATRGVPLKVAMRGIDRYFERYYAKGPRRRPVRIDFCEADVMDVFDEWKRAVGVGTLASDFSGSSGAAETGGDNGAAGAEDGGGRRHGSLPLHLERVMARLTTLRTGSGGSLDIAIEAAVRELDTVRGGARSLRGEARQALLERLQALDAALLEAARRDYDEAALRELAAEADAELAPFRARMPQPAYEQSRLAAINRLLRERLRLPVMSFE